MLSKNLGKKTLLLFVLCFLIGSQSLFAKVEVKKGPTPIPGGDAVAAGDLTLMNDEIAVSIAVDTPAPWGMAQGGIIDAAYVNKGKIAPDRLTLVDFLPHKWSEWTSVDAEIKVLSSSPQEAQVEVKRNWRTASIDTVYTIKDGEDRIYLKTVMTNNGKEALAGDDPKDPAIYSGYGQWAKAGALKEPAGAEGVRVSRKTMAQIKTPGTKYTVAYEKDWALALYAPFADYSSYEGKDMYLKQVLEPGQSKVFEGWFEILPSGDISRAYVAEAVAEGQKIGQFKGQVTAGGGGKVEDPAVVAERDGAIYTWALGDKNGSYKMSLPVGEYELYAAALNHSPSAKQKVEIKESGNKEIDFTGLGVPGQVTFKITDQNKKPLYARLALEKGVEQPIVFLGTGTILTKIKPVGEAASALAPGDYEFSVSHADPFFGKAVKVPVTVKSGQKETLPVVLDITADPEAKGWYNADLHHHSNLLDADTPPEFVVRSQLAAGVDFAFISDHDTVGSHEGMAKYAKEAGLPFIPGLEVSPSWAHFNVYPLPLNKGLGIDSARATAGEIFAAARKAGAKVIAVNHPTIEYGYFTARDRGTIPGGVFEKGFDLLEINGLEKFEKDLPLYWEFWNNGERYYLTGGTDNHNVWKDKSAYMRAFVHVDGKATVDGFLDGLLAGRAFISQGPLIYPEVMFGQEVKAAEAKSLKFNIEAVDGLKKATLMVDGKEAEVKEFQGAPEKAETEFNLKAPKAGGWYSLIVEDADGHRAWSNPNWIVD